MSINEFSIIILIQIYIITFYCYYSISHLLIIHFSPSLPSLVKPLSIFICFNLSFFSVLIFCSRNHLYFHKSSFKVCAFLKILSIAAYVTFSTLLFSAKKVEINEYLMVLGLKGIFLNFGKLG